MDIERLIIEVEKRPAVWCRSDLNRGDRNFTAKCWLEISEVIQSPVDVLKKKWKSLRDNFRVELKKSSDPRLPVDQHQSTWQFFKMLFFLRDSMIGRKISGSSTEALSLGSESSASSCASPALSSLGVADISEDDNQESSEVPREVSPKPRRRRRRSRGSMESETDKRSSIEKEKLVIEKLKLQLLIRDNKKWEKQENDSDRHFLLSLLPDLKRIPEWKKAYVKIKLQMAIHEGTYDSTNNVDIYRPWES